MAAVGQTTRGRGSPDAAWARPRQANPHATTVTLGGKGRQGAASLGLGAQELPSLERGQLGGGGGQGSRAIVAARMLLAMAIGSTRPARRAERHRGEMR